MLDFSEQYRHRCLSPLLAAFASGGSCNVDVLCNSNIKFGCLLDHCRQHINDDSYLVTGHYARHVRVRTPGTPDRSVLARPVTWSSGTDVLNDQTHFLADVCLEKQLPSALFPLGALFESKSDVRRVAEELDLQHVARKKTSTGLCFVNEHMKSSRKQAAGAFPMWLHSQRLQDSAAEDRDSPHDAADETMRPTKWMLLCPGDSDGLETMRDVTRDVRGLHCDQRHELFEHRREEESLPAYFVTQGERLHLLMRRRSPLQDAGASVERFYVARKILRPTSKKGLSVFSCEDDVTDTNNTMGLAVIILSRSNDISSMLFREVDVALRHNWDHATPCSQLFVAFRHQDSMMPCAIRHVKPGRATVTLQGGHQARCPVPGQLAVFYARTGDGDGELTAVVGCGWIA
ncbi:tRNA methyltransferase, putative [Bodo saltans]|uniref:tRNA methyltransferase, putative n=1 Tax=Bodo saltans TaxID=75058 RepID=A0A0S4J0D7_BODSA|nr:tRNA methyltransferase, putative [Bodo saltans]|eukprot:CUG34551.1 tRNA methyltransferase, putative [Bodo saltans]